MPNDRTFSNVSPARLNKRPERKRRESGPDNAAFHVPAYHRPTRTPPSGFSHPYDVVSGQPLADLDGQALTAMVIE